MQSHHVGLSMQSHHVGLSMQSYHVGLSYRLDAVAAEDLHAATRSLIAGGCPQLTSWHSRRYFVTPLFCTRHLRTGISPNATPVSQATSCSTCARGAISLIMAICEEED
ncbi:hypothetical protein PMIN04_011430 [Paraphaeosphaeria minitans]